MAEHLWGVTLRIIPDPTLEGFTHLLYSPTGPDLKAAEKKPLKTSRA